MVVFKDDHFYKYMLKKTVSSEMEDFVNKTKIKEVCIYIFII